MRDKLKREIKRVLVIQWAGLGDMVLATPALYALRRLYPEARVSLLTNTRSTDIVRGSKDIDNIFVFGHLRDLLFKIGSLRSQNFDMAINLYRLYTLRGALKMYLLFLAIGAKFWVGRDTNKRGFFYHLKVGERLPDKKHEVEHKLDVVRALGAEVEDINFHLEFDQNDEDFVSDLLERERVNERDVLVGVNCSTFRPERNWTIRGYRQLAEELTRRASFRVAFSAREIDRKIFKEINCGLSVKPVDLIGKLNVRQLAAFIKRCSVFITPDSGPMHLAAALRVPVVSLFGEGEYYELRPFGEESLVRVITTPVKIIRPSEVISAIKELLGEEDA